MRPQARRRAAFFFFCAGLRWVAAARCGLAFARRGWLAPAPAPLPARRADPGFTRLSAIAVSVLSAAFSSSSTWDPVNTASTRRRRCTRRLRRDSLSCRSTNCDPMHILYGINDCNALNQQQRPPIRGRRDWRRRTRRDLPKNMHLANGVPFFFFSLCGLGIGGFKTSRRTDLFHYWKRKRDESYFFFSVS